MKTLYEKLVDILVTSKVITKEQLEEILKVQKEKGGSLRELLVKKGYIAEMDLMILLSEQLNIPPINLSRYSIDPEVISLIPERVAKYYHLLPISRMEKTLTVAMADPLNIFAIDDIKTLTGYKIKPVICTHKEIIETIESCYRQKVPDIEEFSEEELSVEKIKSQGEESFDADLVKSESEKAPIVRMVNLILVEAIKKRASDIHIEPCEKILRIRYRIDGELQEALTIPKKSQNAVITRLKIMSGLDITEFRIPQDGRFNVIAKDKEIDFRVSVLPITFGGKVVLRVLDKSNLKRGLSKLGFREGPMKAFEKAIAQPYGMILITGPTGSGKSTTLYSILNSLNTVDKNIVTVEDPVEYKVEGITQMQVKPNIGLTFASGLRAILRQSPDVVMIGEIRDFETADIAIKASLTGQLVFSTLHTNDSVGAITRLIDMGIEPFLISSSLIMVAAQRLCRRICPHCKEEYTLSSELIRELNSSSIPISNERKVYRGKGCSHCSNTGYYGRMGTLEILVMDDTIKDMVIKGTSNEKIREYVKNKGMSSLRDNILDKLFAGETTVEEVLRTTLDE